MQGASFWVQREVNGSEHLLPIVAIIIKRLWVVEALQFIRLEGHYHMLWHSDDVARVCNSWATFPQHGIDLQICKSMQGVISQRILKFKLFAAL